MPPRWYGTASDNASPRVMETTQMINMTAAEARVRRADAARVRAQQEQGK